MLSATGFDNTHPFMLNYGGPGVTWLTRSAQLMRNAAKKRLKEESVGVGNLLQYGAPAGDPRFLRAMQKFLSAEYGNDVKLESLVATAGASSGLFYNLSLMFPHKCPVFCEELTYMMAIEVLKSLHFPLVSVPIQQDGINIDVLEQQFIAHRPKHPPRDSNQKFWAVLYLVPTFHNPTGRVLSEVKSKQLVALARKYDVLVLCDDVYNLLYYEGEKPPKRLFAYDNENDPSYKGNVISNGSFSKILSPGIRLGWMELPAWIKHTYWDNHPVTDTCLNFTQSGVVASALEDGSVAKFVNELRTDYAGRVTTLARILSTQLPAKCQFDVPKGGYFIWLKLPPGVNCAKLQEKAKKEGLVFQEGPRSYVGEDNSKVCNYVRLSISYYDREKLYVAFEKFCRILRDYVRARKSIQFAG